MGYKEMFFDLVRNVAQATDALIDAQREAEEAYIQLETGVRVLPSGKQKQEPFSHKNDMVKVKDKRSFAMPYNTYPYQVKPLAFAYDALEPYIDAETMHYHHDKHYQKYVDQLNNALKPYPNLQQFTLEQLLTRTDEIPNAVYDAVMRNGGGVYNHMLFFDGLAPVDTGRHKPQGRLADRIARTFTSFEDFKQQFNARASAVFGSGWTCLSAAPHGALEIINLANQDTLIASGRQVVMLIDVWEHAYYLKYKIERDKYIEAFWNVVNFPSSEPR